MDASTLPKGIAQEKSDQFNKPGVYRHPQTGAELTCYPGKRAVAQADAFVRLGFERVGELPTLTDIKAKDDAQIAKEKAEATATAAPEPTGDTQSDEPTVAELKAQLAAEQTARKAAEKAAKKAEKAASKAAEKPETNETASQPDGTDKEQ